MNFPRMPWLCACSLLIGTSAVAAELSPQTEQQVIEWRRDLHANPELGNRESRTSKLVAAHLRQLGMEVHEGIAHTGVIGYLAGAQPGPLVALRADMDALPVSEGVDLPFASKVTTQYRGETVGVMHACGHDTHVAMLMGLAQTLAAERESLRGRFLFIFQPAEEGPPEGEEGGAQLMLAEGLFSEHYYGKPDAVLGMHVTSRLNVGFLGLRSGPMLASADTFSIHVNGKQTHGSRPWDGIDPIVVGSEIVLSLQHIVSREIDITATPTIVTVGQFKGGIRQNIIPDSAEMLGTIRSFDPALREKVIAAIERRATNIAEAAGTTAEFKLRPGGYAVTVNHPELTAQLRPALESVVGKQRVITMPLITGAEDFSFYAREVPGLFFFVGVTPSDQDAATAASNHSPLFYVDEDALAVGMRSMLAAVHGYLDGAAGANSGDSSDGFEGGK